MNGKHDTASTGRGQRPARSFLLDALELGELHVELLRADVAAAGHSMRVSLTLLVVAASLLIAAAPVLLFALAAWLETAFTLSHAASLALAGLGASLVSGMLILAAWKICKQGLAKLARSQEELKQNVVWLKQSLRQSNEPPQSSNGRFPYEEK